MPKRRSELTSSQAARVLQRLRHRLDQHHKGNVLDLARGLGVSQPALWRLLNNQAKPSLATAEALAGLEGASVESILTSARDRAAELALEADVPRAAVMRVLAEPEEEPARPVLWYVDRMRLFAALEAPGGPPPPAATLETAARRAKNVTK